MTVHEPQSDFGVVSNKFPGLGEELSLRRNMPAIMDRAEIIKQDLPEPWANERSY
ncbi:hypothetical protein ANO14919_066070 [Xylariales sp. No.14919]|nr:hypothetical protein ANO14919_066070 [Xylariales sp. No.14919]